MTQGGYATFNVVDEDFVTDIPDAVNLAHAGPMMCAGITVYSPLRRWSIGNFVKVVERVPVRIAWANPPQGLALCAGLSASVTVHTR